MKMFTNSLEGTFIRRPNRFITVIETEQGPVTAHCPNPGRLQELLYPGVRVILEKSQNPGRKLEYTLAAVEHNGCIAPLYSARANIAARELLLDTLFPDALIIHSEQQILSSRFDYIVDLPNSEKAIVEVKHCSLVEHGVAMFPDAPTERGCRHIEELLEARRIFPKTSGHIIFAITHGDPVLFVPSVHTDPRFSLLLEEAAKEGLIIHCCSFRCSREGDLTIVSRDIPLDTALLRAVSADSVLYISICSPPEDSENKDTAKWYIVLHKNRRISGLKKKLTYRNIKTYPIYYLAPIWDTALKLFSGSNCIVAEGYLEADMVLYKSDRNPFYLADFRNIFYYLRHSACMKNTNSYLHSDIEYNKNKKRDK